MAGGDDAKDMVRRFLERGLGAGELATIAELLDPDVAYHGGIAPGSRGSDEVLAAVAEYREAFPDLSITVEDQVAEGDRVATRLTVRGTHTGELGGLEPTGRRVELEVINLMRLDGGRIAEVWAQSDSLSLLEQLGLD